MTAPVVPNEPDWRILHAKARRHAWTGEGWLSIKSFTGGRAHYSLGAGHHAVGDDSYLVLNHGRTYSIEIDQPHPIESFCIFFAPGFANDVFRNCSAADSVLIDNDSKAPCGSEFFEKTYRHDDVVSPLMKRLKRTHGSCDPIQIEEQMHQLLAALLKAHRREVRQAEKLPSVRVATRHELYRRAARARDFADSMFAESLSLKQIAVAAALSPNHLLRVFQQVYRMTPHEFLTVRRIDEAKRLLKRGEMSVTEICFAVGFQSLGSFSSLFQRRIGLSPTAFRAAKK